MKNIVYLTAILGAATIASCAHITAPISEQASVSHAVHAVAGATKDIIAQHAATRAEWSLQQRRGDSGEFVYRTDFDPAAARSLPAVNPVDAAYAQAAAALEAFSSVANAIEEGHNESSIARHAQSASMLLRSADAVAGAPIGSLANALLRDVAVARERKRLDEVLRLGAPNAVALLDALSDATPELYRLRVAVSGAAISEIMFEQACLLDEVESVAAGFALPDAGTELALLRAQLEADVHALRLELDPASLKRAMPVGDLPYTPSAQERLSSLVDLARNYSEQRRHHADAVASFHEQLIAFIQRIDIARIELDALTKQKKGTAP